MPFSKISIIELEQSNVCRVSQNAYVHLSKLRQKEAFPNEKSIRVVYWMQAFHAAMFGFLVLFHAVLLKLSFSYD